MISFCFWGEFGDWVVIELAFDGFFLTFPILFCIDGKMKKMGFWVFKFWCISRSFMGHLSCELISSTCSIEFLGEIVLWVWSRPDWSTLLKAWPNKLKMLLDCKWDILPIFIPFPFDWVIGILCFYCSWQLKLKNDSSTFVFWHVIRECNLQKKLNNLVWSSNL